MPKKKLKKKSSEHVNPHRVRAVVEELLPTEPINDLKDENTMNENKLNESSEQVVAQTEETTPIENSEPPIAQHHTTVSDSELFESSDKVGFLPLFLITLGVALLVAVVSGGIYVYIQGTGESSDTKTAVQTAKPSSMPGATSTPIASLLPSATPSASATALNTYSLSVLNGSGRIGEAGKVKTLLEKAKFKVSYTGNAKSYDFEKTQLQFKESVPESVREALKTTLQGSYEIEMGETLTSKNVYDIVVTVGAN